MQPRWRLTDHVRACRVDEQVILLDLRRNKYLGVSGPALSGLSGLIDGWPAVIDGAGEPRHGAAHDAWLLSMSQQGMLTTAPRTSIRQASLEEPARSANPENESLPIGTWHQLLSLWRHATQTALWLRRRSLADIAGALEATRIPEPCDVATDDTAALERAVAVYVFLRPFAFTAHDRCLHDSLTLHRYLTAQRLATRWVIGVRTRPFGAHSWVQRGSLVLNDQHENVRRYQPILVV